MAEELKTGSDVHVEERGEASSELNKSAWNLDKEETSNELNSTEAEIFEVRKENARLKMVLQQIRKEYHSLQSKLIDTEQNIKKNDGKASIAPESTDEEPELISLRLGQNQADAKGNDNSSNCNSNKSREHESVDHNLELGLSFNFGASKADCEDLNSKPSPTDSIHETTREPSKALKMIRSSDQDELSQQPNGKRARVSVRAKCDTPTMNDGCQWRKYGQKISKGNPCPRAYYRCTVAPSCPVRKQVQRCVDDLSILITTYEGSHNHPLPVSAASMASTTSAAASMLMSGSSTSQQGVGQSAATMSSTPFYMPNSYSSQPFSTITLDLTSNPSAIYPHTNLYSSPLNSNTNFPFTNFNFSSLDSNTLPTWGGDYVNYGTSPYSNFGRPSQEQFFRPYNPGKKTPELHQGFLTETLTKALTSDPSFQSIITAALSNLVDSGTVNQTNEN